jgi:LmbE family N-acetylglucosaminyl deacetylase
VIPLHLPGEALSVMAVGAHPDDIEIGCGGTLLALTRSRDVFAHVVVLTGDETRRREAQTAADLFLNRAVSSRLDVFDLPDRLLPAHWEAAKEALVSVSTRPRPDLILCPRVEDAHQDHRVTAELVTQVWRDALVLQYEIPKWDGDLRPVTTYVPLDATTAHDKVDLLSRAFPSQLSKDWWDDETFVGLMRLRGLECRTRFAEGFVAAKTVLDVRQAPKDGPIDPSGGRLP